MKILLTGADGFLGSHLLRYLLKDGHKVRAFLQKTRNHSTIKGLDYEAFYGDVLNEADLDSALDDCDALIHTVANTNVWPSRDPVIWQINHESVKTISRLVLKHNLKRFIYIGTANSFGYGPKQSPGDENTPFNAGKYGLDYIDSKKASQDFLIEEYNKKGLPVVIINPSFMIGEYDTKPGSGKMVLSLMNERIPVCSKGGRCFTYVGDVAVAVVNALSMGQTGECYITGGTNLSYNEFFSLTAEIAGVKAPKICPPPIIMYTIAWIMEAIGRIRNRPPLFSQPMVMVAMDGHYYSSAKARKTLNMPETDIKIAIKKTITWFIENGYK